MDRANLEAEIDAFIATHRDVVGQLVGGIL
jgi:hypothetical protein